MTLLMISQGGLHLTDVECTEAHLAFALPVKNCFLYIKLPILLLPEQNEWLLV